ncbi:Fur family transcriptional regulator [Alienimonas sp. DA493]|uniref:Fur family transcriptional regulator n=1 Tax=Alienimonas sp. DA493 TaxID=3373605 RepID=UPI0037548D25
MPPPCRVYIVPEAAAEGGVRSPPRPPVPKAARPDAPVVPPDDALRDRLRETGLRVTPARLALMKELAGAGVPLSHGEVVDRLRPPAPTGRGGKKAADAPRRFDQSTLFRGLTDLSDAGLLARLDLGDAVRRYEWLPAEGDAAVHPHHVCTECGRIVCLEGFALKLTPATGSAREQVGTIGEVVLRGRCGECTESESAEAV